MTELVLFASWLAWGQRRNRKRPDPTFTIGIDRAALERELFSPGDR